ncbi:MAG: hypothetical protein ACXVY5_01790 [Gaiellales bacterium]
MKPRNHLDLGTSVPLPASTTSPDDAGTIDIQRLLAWYYATETNPPRHEPSNRNDREAA